MKVIKEIELELPNLAEKIRQAGTSRVARAAGVEVQALHAQMRRGRMTIEQAGRILEALARCELGADEQG